VASSEPRWHPAAIEDAESARNWYTERSPFAARGFLLALDAAVDAVIEAPKRWPERSHGCRQYVFTSRYPFSLVYRLSPDVEIVAVAHHRRKPQYWARR
jgi:plasmid stabilization system protein ParE